MVAKAWKLEPPEDAARVGPRARRLDFVGRGSIASRLVAIVAVIAMPLFFVGLYQAHERLDKAERVATERLASRLQDSIEQLDHVAAAMRSAVDAVEAFAWPEWPDVARMDAHLRAIRNMMPPYVHNVNLTALDGRLIASSIVPPARRGGIDFSDRRWFREALATHGTVVSEPIRSRSDGRWIVVFARLIRDPGGRSRGMAVVAMDLDAVSQMVARTVRTPSLLVSVLAPDAVIVARSTEAAARVGTSAAHVPGVRRVVGGERGGGVMRSSDGVERLSAWGPTNQTPWTVYVGIDRAMARATAVRAALVDLAALVITTGIAVAVALLLGRRIARPVRELQAAAHRVADGDYTIRVPVGEGAELGALARHFNVMMERISDADERLRASQARLNEALNAGRMAVWEWVPGGWPEWGEGRELIKGPVPAGCHRHPPSMELVHADDREALLQAGARAMQGRSPLVCQFRMVWQDGSVHWINAMGDYEPARPGRPGRLVGVSQDVTERVETGERLRDWVVRCNAVLETTTDTVIMVDASARILYANPAVKALFGWEPAELVGQPLARLNPQHWRGRDADMERVPCGDLPLWRSTESLARHRDGREFPVDVTVSVIDSRDSVYYVGFVRDATQRKAAEAALREANASLERRVAERTAELEAVNRDLESFSYTVAHDLRAPLRAIEGFSAMLEEDLAGRLEDELSQHLGRIRASAKLMAEMIDELLEFARIGRAEVQRTTVELGRLGREVVEEHAIAYPAARIEVGDLPAVEGDPTLLRVVLGNLVGNALKFSSRRADARVAVRARRAGDMVQVEVTDNGVGFDPRYAGKLFGVFQRLHSQHEFEGTGIGLAIVARIVARHGGQVGAESRPGEGATFRFTVPGAAS